MHRGNALGRRNETDAPKGVFAAAAARLELRLSSS